MSDESNLAVLDHLGLTTHKAEYQKVALALAYIKRTFKVKEEFKLNQVMRPLSVEQTNRKWLRTLLGKLVERGYLYRPSSKKYAKAYDSFSNWLSVAHAKIDSIENAAEQAPAQN
jgi:hypothetical protein